MRKSNFVLLFLVLAALQTLGADTQPVQKKKKLTLQDLLKATGSSSKHSTTVAGVRGLEETGGVVDTKARNYVAVEKLEAVVVRDDELAKFVAEGKLR